MSGRAEIIVGRALVALGCEERRNGVGATSQTYNPDDLLHAVDRLLQSVAPDTARERLSVLLTAARVVLNPPMAENVGDQVQAVLDALGGTR